MIRVLVADDSALARDIVKSFLHSDSDFSVIGEAVNGAEAVRMADELRPDLITMDLEMPVMNGVEAIRAINATLGTPIVVVSCYDNAKNGYEASASGAIDVYSKDDFSLLTPTEKQQSILQTLKMLPRSVRTKTPPRTQKGESIASREIKAIVLAASTGGPKAIKELLMSLPQGFQTPIIAVQHNSSGFDKGFVEWLNAYTQLNVKLADDGERIENGNIYFAPTDRHLTLIGDRLVINNDLPVNNQKPSADVLFASAAKSCGRALIGVVLTGMGSDGAAGSAIVQINGGIVIAQDEESSLIYGMPKAVVENNAADFVLPLGKIAEKLMNLCRLPDHAAALSSVIFGKAGLKINQQIQEQFDDYIEKKYGEKTVDIDTVLRHEDIYELARHFTVGETYFLREFAQFELMQNIILPKFSGKTVKICSAACSIGCEAYTIAAVIKSYNKVHFGQYPVAYQIDAFDISAEAINTAREGKYSEHTLREDGAKYHHLLDGFVEKTANGFQVTDQLKEHINFWVHNILEGLEHDKYDIVFFRNALIYFTNYARSSAVDILAHTLTGDGVLFVGISETTTVDHKLLVQKHINNIFYHKKKLLEITEVPHIEEKPAAQNTPPIDPREIVEILQQNRKGERTPSAIASLIIKELGRDNIKTDSLLTELEAIDSSVYTKFLRGDYFFYSQMNENAVKSYELACALDDSFWPSFYRVVSIAEINDKASVPYHINRAIKSIEKGRNMGYEVFMGGFSPDNYRAVL